MGPGCYLWLAGAVLLVAGSGLIVCAPWCLAPLGLPIDVGYGLALMGMFRLWSAHRAGRLGRAAAGAQAVLRLGLERIPARSGQVYFGQGFGWDQRHAERFHLQSSRGVEALGSRMGPFAHAKGSDALGGNALVHGVGADRRDRPLWVGEGLLSQHTLILGTTGVGKTRLFELLILQAIRRDEAVVVVDPKGDGELLNRVVAECRRMNKEDRFLLFAPPYPDLTVSYDPLKNWHRVSEIPDRIAPLIPGGGAAEPFRKFAWGAINVIAHALEACGEPISLAKIRRYVLDDTWGLVRAFLKKRYPKVRWKVGEWKTQPEAVAQRWLDLVQAGQAKDNEALRRLIALALRPRENYQKMTNSLIPILDSLSTGPMLRIMSPEHSELDWQHLTDKGQVAYLFLGSMLGYETANAVAKMALADFQACVGATYAYRRPERHLPVNVFVDELSNVVTPEFINLLNKSRGAGVRVTMAAQTGSDLEAALGSRALAEQVLGNANIVIQFRAQSYLDACAFSDLTGRCTIRVTRETTTVRPAFGLTGKRDVADFDASYGLQRQEQELPRVAPEAVMELPVGQFFGRWGGRVYKGRVPLLPAAGEDYLAQRGARS